MTHREVSTIAIGVVLAVAMLWPAAARAQRYGRGYPAASLRLQVEPKQTEVFIDGYWSGIVDDFDGFFQRMRLEPGEHEIELYLEGYRSLRQKVFLQPDATFRIRHTMVPLDPGEAPVPRPVPRAGTPPPDPYAPPRGERAERPARSARGAFGALAIRVQPADADVLVDGEPWDGPDPGERLVIELAEGEHRVEVSKHGFVTFRSPVRIRRGETTTLNVSLTK